MWEKGLQMIIRGKMWERGLQMIIGVGNVGKGIINYDECGKCGKSDYK